MSLVIEVRDLTMSYGRHTVLTGLDLDVEEGEIVAILGPNGSGKTTTVEILEGFRRRSGGAVSVLGHDPDTAPSAWRERIGIVPQESQLIPELTVTEAVSMQTGYFRSGLDPTDVVAMVGLDDAADRRSRKLSGGQQRRLDLGLALVGDPELLFLDEPTTGFDPSARRQAWDLIARLGSEGRTVLLTTHYMDEAEALADRIVVIADGTVAATGTADELSNRISAETAISWIGPAEVTPPADLPSRWFDGRWYVESSQVTPDLHRLTGWAIDRQLDLVGLRVTRPDLEDVFLHLTEVESAHRAGDDGREVA